MPDDRIRLTIALPTFDRNALLLENLKLLLPQLDERVELLILDDHSPEPVRSAVKDLAWAFPRARIRVERNHFNIGLSGNVVRCFEAASADWMWLMGDDDAVEPDAVASVLAAIEESPEAVYINFCSRGLVQRSRPVTTRGLDSFVEAMDHFGNVLFMSSGVYRLAPVREKMRIGFHYGYTFASHLALLFSVIGPDTVCRYSERTVCSHGSEASKKMGIKMWNWLTLGYGVPVLFELPLGDRNRRRLAEKYYDSVSVMGHCVWQLVRMAGESADSREALYLFDQLCYRNALFFRGRPWRKMKRFVWRLMVRWPGPGLKAARWFIHRKTGQEMTGDGIAGRFERL